MLAYQDLVLSATLKPCYGLIRRLMTYEEVLSQAPLVIRNDPLIVETTDVATQTRISQWHFISSQRFPTRPYSCCVGVYSNVLAAASPFSLPIGIYGPDER
jgi:hypothetical protein